MSEDGREDISFTVEELEIILNTLRKKKKASPSAQKVKTEFSEF